MFEIRFHGRGGQGTVLLAKMLADAVCRSGRGECLAIPEFGVERRGAPVAAYARISDGPILVRTRIYAPDAVVVLDPGLAALPAVTQGLKPGGLFVICAERPAAELAGRWPNFTVRTVPARRIAIKHQLGSATDPVLNTTVLGALTALLDVVSMEHVEAAIRSNVPAKIEANVAAAREAYEFCRKEAHAAA